MSIENCPLRATRSRILNLSIEPYRPFFTLGVLHAVIIMGFWFTYLHGTDMHRNFFHFSISALQAHLHWMLFGFTNFYIFGFLLTAFPRWINAPSMKASRNFLLAILLFLSQLLLWIGTIASLSLLKIALILELCLMLVLLKNLAKLYFTSQGRRWFDQPSMVLVSLGFAIIAQIFYQCSLWIGFFPYYFIALTLAQYLYLLLLMITVAYRILPFFTARLAPETEPKRGTFTLPIAFGLLILLSLSEIIPLPLPPIKGVLLILLGLVWLKELWNWNLKKATSNFLLFSHYIAFGWGILFLWVKGIATFFPNSFLEIRTIQTAIAHLFFVGSLSTLIWGISTRVTRGHGGLGFVLGKIDYVIFALLQLATCTRTLIPFLAMRFPALEQQSAHAAFFWWLAFLLWGIRYLPALLKKG